MSPYNFSIQDEMRLAEAKLGIDGWKAYQWSATDGGKDSIVKGCVPSGVYAKGPRKGLPKFRPATPGTERVVVITEAEMIAAAEAYEVNGTCWDCKGTGKTSAGWSKAEGTEYRKCTRCDGSGRVEAQAVAA